MTLAGGGEQALRFIPFAAGLGLLAAFGWLAWRRLGPAGGLTAAALAACSWPLIYYANEFKQYSSDALNCIFVFRVCGKNSGGAVFRAAGVGGGRGGGGGVGIFAAGDFRAGGAGGDGVGGRGAGKAAAGLRAVDGGGRGMGGVFRTAIVVEL